jgi:hypothetical protein
VVVSQCEAAVGVPHPRIPPPSPGLAITVGPLHDRAPKEQASGCDEYIGALLAMRSRSRDGVRYALPRAPHGTTAAHSFASPTAARHIAAHGWAARLKSKVTVPPSPAGQQ